MVAAANIHELSPTEPLSPELVLVLSPEVRAQVLASLGAPSWPEPRLRLAANTPIDEPTDEPIGPSLRRFVAARVLQLGAIFAVVTILIIAMSFVAHAVR